jgi:hypothetical protein
MVINKTIRQNPITMEWKNPILFFLLASSLASIFFIRMILPMRFSRTLLASSPLALLDARRLGGTGV